MSQFFGSVSRADIDLPGTDLISWTRPESHFASAVRSSSQTSRVTLKIDVPHTDHSHVIGRGGRNIKAVMQDTQCHIHFPDSNRASTAEKSNQVSISGHVSRVDHARKRIRDILPIEFTFALPFGRTSQPGVFRNSPIVRQLEDLHNVEVSFRNIYSLFDSHVMVGVKGLSCNCRQTKAACQALIQFYYGPNTTVPVNMSINMDPNYQVNFLGNRTPDDLSRLVLQATGALVTVQDARHHSELDNTSALSGPSAITPRLQQLSWARKARAKPITIEISGNVDSVFLARQLISNLLPVTLMFGVCPEESEWLKHLDISQLGEQYDVTVDITTKTRQPIRSVVIRTIEKNIRSLYSTWQVITGIIQQLGSNSILTPLNLPHGCRNGAPTSSGPPTTSEHLADKGRNGSRLALLQNPDLTNSSSPFMPMNWTELNTINYGNLLPLVCPVQSTPADSPPDRVVTETTAFEQNAQLRLTSGLPTIPNRSMYENRLSNIDSPITIPFFRDEMKANARRTTTVFKHNPNHIPPPRAMQATVLADLNPSTNFTQSN